MVHTSAFTPVIMEGVMKDYNVDQYLIPQYHHPIVLATHFFLLWSSLIEQRYSLLALIISFTNPCNDIRSDQVPLTKGK